MTNSHHPQEDAHGRLPLRRRRHGMSTRLLTLLALHSIGTADVQMPRIFGDGMVLQRDSPVAIWGRGAPGEAITVQIAGLSISTRAAPDGNWRLHLPPSPAGGPHRLIVSGKSSLDFEDVLFGDVWIGVGQSNMGLPVEVTRPTPEELAGHPNLRLYQEHALPAPEAEWLGTGKWEYCSPETTSVFSGALFYCGLELRRELDVPIGLIQASVGGTRIECWIDRDDQYQTRGLMGRVLAAERRYDAFDVDAERLAYRKARRAWRDSKAGAQGNHHPGRPKDKVEFHIRTGNVGELFNSRIAPIIPFTMKGVLWYQGESNVFSSHLYESQLRLLVTSWRRRWRQGDFPFAWVQLANFSEGGASDWPGVREAMRRSLSLPNTGMVVATDLGSTTNIHPRNKRDVGKRLARWALGTTYGRDLVISGPLYASVEIDGPRATVHFTHVDGGLHGRGQGLAGFQVRGSDEAWFAATASIAGETVIVESKKVESPSQVRYAWRSDPPCTLYNGAGLPASPFTSEP